MNKQAVSTRDSTSTSTPSSISTARPNPILTPSSTSSTPSEPTPNHHPSKLTELLDAKMEPVTARADQASEDVKVKREEEDLSASNTSPDPKTGVEGENNDVNTADATRKKGKNGKLKTKKKTKKCKKHTSNTKTSKTLRKSSRKDDTESETESEESESPDSASSSDSEDTSSSDDDRRWKKSKKKRASAKRKAKSKKHRRSKKYESSSESDSEDSSDETTESDSEDDVRSRRKNKSRKKRQVETEEESEAEEEPATETAEVDQHQQLQQLQQLQALTTALLEAQISGGNANPAATTAAQLSLNNIIKAQKKNKRLLKQKEKKKKKKASTLEYKRVDQLWDSNIHNYKLTESAEDQVDEFDEYIFTVRRKFDWENKYRNTVVDIKSKLLRDALAEVMKDVKGVSLVEEQPCVDPNMLFLYLEELRIYRKKTLKALVKKEKKKKTKKRIQLQMAHCKVLEGYLDEDYEDTKKTLEPMLAAGNITFDLLWALFKPNTIAYTTTYGSVEDPRCFKVDYANKESSFMRGEWYAIEGRYLEYDGKTFGLGDFEVSVDAFRGPRKITSLATYPLKYHKDPEAIKKQLVERGKKFVLLQGMNYRFHKGLAFQKRKKTVAKVNINGRVMIDPAIFRRINPNYPISLIKPKEDDLVEDEDEECSQCCGESSDEEGGLPDGAEGPLLPGEQEERERMKYKVYIDRDKKVHVIQVPVDENGQELRVEKLEKLEGDENSNVEGSTYDFTEEELMIASPVVLGFAFSEKLWLEFSLSGIRDIEWNEGAFSSLVLPNNQKSIVKGMVSSHKFHAAETIDDVVQGKGRGLVFVLHGPPGVGKTLTAEGIAEYLKCPLYAVSAGELGTDSRILEHELQKIMDIAHSWGAVLLLDEADVFLEKREVHDIHRNALVSIFLRLLEYFQGILFLTTNRVETFDDAFQSRIHMPLRYGDLSKKAKMEIWKTFIDKVREMMDKEGGKGVEPFGEREFEALARNALNGRQIKNAVRTAQSLALSENEKFCINHIERVLEVGEDFNNDLRGGRGYLEAMRSYT